MGYTEEELEQEIAEEKRELEYAWQEQVRSVLSNTRIDPKCKGQQQQWFERYEGDVTPDQVSALQRSDYGKRFKEFIGIWKKLPEDGRGDLSTATEVFRLISVITHGPYNELCHQEKNANNPFTQLEILSKAQWLQTYFWGEGWSDFDSHDLGEQLNHYIELGMEWPYLERLVLRLSVHRAGDAQRKKVKIPFDSPMGLLFAYFPLRLLGFLLPILLWIGVDAAIVVWSLNHLKGESSSLWAIVGLVYVGLTVPVSIIHYGTSQVRNLLKRIIDPTWDPYEPKVNADLSALENAVNSFRKDEHINLRLVRTQLSSLQRTDIHLPVQLLTLIDRASTKGVHSW